MSKIAIQNEYVDYLLSDPHHVSAVDLSEALDNQYSHDQITRMLAVGQTDDNKLYLKGKRFIKSHTPVGKKVLILDDSILSKPYSEVNGLVTYHYDHSQHDYVKGINFISALWADEKHTIPLSMEPVKKEWAWQVSKGAYGWKTAETKNSIFRRMVGRLTRSKQIDYVLADSWYSSKENMQFIVDDCETHFIMALKSNRVVARSEHDAKKGIYKPLEVLRLGKCAVKVYLKGLDFPVLVVKKVFKNGDESSGTLYLACSDLELAYEQIFTLYKRRWKVEEYHKSLKQNCSLGKCQASSHAAQQSHLYLAVFAFLQLEKAKAVKGQNHFALMRDLNILSVKYGMKAIKKHLHTTLSKLNKAA